MSWFWILIGILFSPVLIITDINFFGEIPGNEIPGIPWFITESPNKRCSFGIFEVSSCTVQGDNWPQCERRIDSFCDKLYPDDSWKRQPKYTFSDVP